MRKALQRYTSLLLGVLLAAALWITPAAAAQSGRCGEGVEWSLDGGVLRISGHGAMTNYTDEDLPPWHESAGSITAAVVEQGVTTVGNLAFFGCSALGSVTLGGTVTGIGAAAFKDCAALKSVTLPTGLTAIGEAAFENCVSLSSVSLPDGLASIGDFAFYRCEKLAAMVIPASVQTLGVVVFAYCTGLVRAEVQCAIDTLPDWTFYGCTTLAEVSLPETVTKMGTLAFENCEKLKNIYYDGAADVTEGSSAQVRPTEKQPASGGVSELLSTDNRVESTTVTNTENANLIEKSTTDYDCKVDGQETTLEEALNAGAEKDVTINAKKTTTITGTVNNSEGWNELEQKVDNALGDGESTVKVDVALKGTKVSGEDLSKIAKKGVEATITTEGGSTWQIDGNSVSKKDISDRDYNLEYTITEVQRKKRPGIESDQVYQVIFLDSTDFNATVGIRVPDAGRQYATLYQNNEVIQTTIVDNDGIAWFSLANVDSKTKYYLGINASDADLNEAIIPDTLAQEYGAEYTLTDASGKQYQVTGRSSRWGITGSRFAIYVAVAIGGVVLIVTLIMVTINRFAKTKAHYAAKAAADDDAIDEDALRMQIMQEMLDEAQKRKKK